MKFAHNFICKFVAGFYEELRGWYSTDLLYNPMKVVDYDFKAQKWEGKIKE